jgi:hypothetical protein
MGGSINIAARFNDGDAICVDGWTNFIPRMVMNETTLSGDDSVVRETLLETMRHDSYAGPQPFRASGYGIVVIDFIDRAIHSMQGYTGFAERKILANFTDLNRTGWTGDETARLKSMMDFHEKGNMDGFEVHASEEGRSLMEAGRLRVVESAGKPIEPYVLDEGRFVDLVKQDTARFLRNETRDMPMVEVDIAAFKVFDYPEGGTLVDMKKHLGIAGFPLTKAEGLNAMFARETESGK